MVNMQIYKTLRKFPTVQGKWTYAIQTQPAPLHVRPHLDKELPVFSSRSPENQQERIKTGTA